MISPLRKYKECGDLYQRQPKIEKGIEELNELTDQERLARFQIADKNDLMYVPSECILYFVRAARASTNNHYYERIYKLLIIRILKQLPKSLETLSDTMIREKALGDFCELLADDAIEYSERLDFYEVRFMQAVKALKINAFREVEKDIKRLESIDDNVELASELEEADEDYDSYDQQIFSIDYRFDLDSAINELPDLQKRILHLLKLEIPIDSNDPSILTISKILKKSEKTIRTHRDKAFAAIRLRCSKGD